MTRQCAVSHCGGATGGHSTLCERHKRTQRRHGHPEQVGVTAHELGPFRKRVAARQVKNAGNPAWQLLAQRWAVLEASATETLAAFARGVPQNRHSLKAVEQVKLIATSLPAVEVVETALAMFIFLHERPQRFRSDRAFKFELARRVRGLTDSHSGTYWDSKSGKMRRVYRDLSPRAMEALSGLLVETFGGAGVYMAGLEKAEADKALADRLGLDAALREMQ